MSVGLDLGTTEFRSIRDTGVSGHLTSRACQTSYLVVRDTAGHRRLLDSTRAIYGTCGDDLVVFGDDAVDCGTMLDQPIIPLLRNGRLPAADPVARQILALIVEAVLPPARTPGEPCCLTVPGGYGVDEDTQSIDIRFFKQLAALRGYSPKLISASQSLALAELSESSFSGVGISLGAANCEFGLVHCGRELARATIAGQLSELAEQFQISELSTIPMLMDDPQTTRYAAWQRQLSKSLADIFKQAGESLAAKGSLRLLQQPACLAVSGGITDSEGFLNLFKDAWVQANWPIRTGQIRIARDARFAVARGNLISALMEVQAPRQKAA